MTNMRNAIDIKIMLFNFTWAANIMQSKDNEISEKYLRDQIISIHYQYTKLECIYISKLECIYISRLECIYIIICLT